jgi:serine/threonine protein kinase
VVKPALQRARFLAPGDKLGKHDLIRQIAVGGMAELYLARTTGLEGFEKLVVIKRILPQYANNSSFVNMFLNEARLAATLHHPNIAQVYDIGQEQGEYFFSMEYVHGEDLGRMLRNANESGVPVSLDAALTLAAGLCAGLHHAHEKTSPEGRPLNVVHRDVSPSNVLVSYDGAVKLVDFGIARAATTPGSTAGGLKGKISYMSPEQCRGKAVLDRRSDVFSVGTILYELTTGRLPFTDETEYGVLNQIVNTDAVPPGKLVDNYPPALEAIVMKALARDPDQRYSSALELQGDLEDFAHENRLRVSPLVLARLMSGLFPARLEEWANARAQGAFFVEQYVVRTLIENSEVDGLPLSEGEHGSNVMPAVAGEMGPPPDDDATAVTTPPVAPDDMPTDVAQPLLGRITETPPPPTRPMRTPVPASAHTQVGVAPDVHHPQPTPRPTPMPRAASPVPGMPGAVPIMTLQPPAPGTLVSQPDPLSYPTHPVHAIGDMTMRVRMPTTVKKTRKVALSLVLIGVVAAAGVTFFVLSRDDGKLDPIATKPDVPTKPEPKPVVELPKDEPAVDPPTDEPPKPEPPVATPKDEPTVEPPKDEPKPAIAKPEVKKPPVVKKPPPKPVVKKDPIAKKDPPKPEPPKPEPPKEGQWKGDSPFMPVRPDKP